MKGNKIKIKFGGNYLMFIFAALERINVFKITCFTNPKDGGSVIG